MKKIYILLSEKKVTLLRFAANGWSNKGFLLPLKFWNFDFAICPWHHEKFCTKSELKVIFLGLTKMIGGTKIFCYQQNFVTQRKSVLSPKQKYKSWKLSVKSNGYMHIHLQCLKQWEILYEMWIDSDHSGEICKGFLLAAKLSSIPWPPSSLKPLSFLLFNLGQLPVH